MQPQGIFEKFDQISKRAVMFKSVLKIQVNTIDSTDREVRSRKTVRLLESLLEMTSFFFKEMNPFSCPG